LGKATRRPIQKHAQYHSRDNQQEAVRFHQQTSEGDRKISLLIYRPATPVQWTNEGKVLAAAKGAAGSARNISTVGFSIQMSPYVALNIIASHPDTVRFVPKLVESASVDLYANFSKTS
jgi:hypothetical protein